MNEMQFINRAELAGRVGSIRVTEVSGVKVARLSLATEQVFKGEDGSAYCDTDWHYITAWNGSGIAPVDTIAKGDFIRVKGRIRSTAYTSSDGIDRRVTDILADTLEIIR